MLREALRSIEGIDVPTFVIWRTARRCYFNAAARRTYPETLGESGSSFARATPFVQELVRAVERSGDAKDAARVEYGGTAFVSVPLYNFDGVIEGTIVRTGRFEDIPEIYREFHTGASLISQIVHLLPVLVYTMRPSGECDFVNRPFLEYAGLALQRGGRIDLEGVVHADDRSNLPAPWRTGDAGRELYAAEVGLRGTDGSYRCHAARLSAIRSRNGAVVKWIGTFVDIEDRLVAEASLAEAHAYLDARVDELERVLDVVPVGIAIANGFESDEVLLNRAMMEILDEPEPSVPYGHRAFRYVRGVDLEQVDPFGGAVEIDYERRDGSSRRIAVTVVPTKRFEGGNGVVAAYADVTDARREELRRETLLAAHRGLSLATTTGEIVAAVTQAFAPFADACAIALQREIVAPDAGLSPELREALESDVAAVSADRREIVVPLSGGSRVLASLALRRAAGRVPFAERDVEMLTDFAQVAAIAIDRAAILERERSVAHRLNRLLLEARLPAVGAVDVSVAYRTADRSAPIGGDWYDAFELPGERIGLSVGDVAGHGIEASIAMYAARQAMRDAAFSGATPAQALASADAVVYERTPERFVTACFAIVDPARERVRYALAGHPPPIVATRDGAGRVLSPGGMPLGVRPGAPSLETELGTADLELFALYTNGVTDRGRDAATGEEELRGIVASASRIPLASTAQAIFDQIFRTRRTGDDAALLVARFPRVPSRPRGGIVRTGTVVSHGAAAPAD